MIPSPQVRLLLASAVLLQSGAGLAIRAEGPAAPPNPCLAPDRFFLDEVWPKVAAQKCLECHKAGGEAGDSKFLLQDPARDPDPAGAAFQRENRVAFARMAARRRGDQSRLLLKAAGELSHGGDEVLPRDSTGYRLLAEFVRRSTGQPGAALPSASPPPVDFFAGLPMMEPRRLLRRVTLSLAARLPSAPERAAVEREGLTAFPPLLDELLREEAFYERLAETFNDLLLVRGYGEGAESALSYDHFSQTRHWTQQFDLSAAGDSSAQQKARYKLTDDYREALLREPLELIKYIVREGRPFTEILTADYQMESPYTARGYGNFEEVEERFRHVADPYEYLPVRLASLKNRTGKDHQESATGFYPHAGVLSTFQYLRRYPTTETNRNRLRARMFYQHFLGVDVMELAARVTDAAAVSAKFEVPTTQAAECVVCHRTVDPVAGVFQDYYSLDGVFGPRKGGWFTDIFPAGFEGEALPGAERWRALPWLAARTVQDPRFATTMVEHAYYLLTGRKVLLPPKGIDDPLFDAKRRAYQAQHAEVLRLAADFTRHHYDFKEALKGWILSPFYRVEGTLPAVPDATRRVEWADLGLERVLSPEQLERKVRAIFGQSWGRLRDPQFALLYGGIDAKEVTERAADPSGAMGAVQRMLANDVACKNVALDFTRPPGERRLFPSLEPELVPGASPEAEARLRQAIIHLHEMLLGRFDAPESSEVDRTYALFTGILADAATQRSWDKLENYSCRGGGGEQSPDATYTIRAWRGVVTYLLRRHEFLYE